MKTRDYWIIRLGSKFKDFEFGQINDEEANKLVVTLHTYLDQLQTSIIQKDINLIKMILTARALELTHTAQKNKFSIKDFFSKCDQICSFLRIWSHLLKKSLMGKFIFWAVSVEDAIYQINLKPVDPNNHDIAAIHKRYSLGKWPQH